MGLIGRIYKQLYVEARGAGPSECLPFSKRRSPRYWAAYQDNTAANHWHGINVAALAARVRADGGSVDASIPPVADLAATLVGALDALLTAQIEKAARDGVAVKDTPVSRHARGSARRPAQLRGSAQAASSMWPPAEPARLEDSGAPSASSVKSGASIPIPIRTPRRSSAPFALRC